MRGWRGFGRKRPNRVALRSGGAFIIETLVIEGDSQTSTTPDQAGFHGDFYSYTYKDDPVNSDLTVYVRAQASRTVGGPAWTGPPAEGADTGSPAGNTLLDKRSEDMAYNPQVIHAMLGSNDLGTYSVDNTLSKWNSYAPTVRNAGIKLVVASPPPYGPGHAGYAAFQAKWDDYIDRLRNPSVRSGFADYYDPIGEHPDYRDPATVDANINTSDDIHLTAPISTPTTGQAKAYAVFKAFMDTLRDTSRANSTVPYEAVWPTSETNLATSTEIIRRFIISGIDPEGLDLGISVSGGGAQISLGGRTYGTSFGTGSGNGHRIYTGDVVDLKLTTSGLPDTEVAIDLMIGSETREITYRTVVEVADVTYEHLGALQSSASATTQNYTNGGVGYAFTAGCPVLFLTSFSNAGGSTDSGPTEVKLTPIGGGSDIILSKRFEQMRSTAASRVIECWSGTGDISATPNYSIHVTRPAAARSNVITYGVLHGADPTPTAFQGNTPVESSNTNHSTPSNTVPAHGISLAAYFIEDDTTPTTVTATSPAILVEEEVCITTDGVGLAIATRNSTGVVEFIHKTGTFARMIGTWKALGT